MVGLRDHLAAARLIRLEESWIIFAAVTNRLARLAGRTS
jgi:hypothetical protein